MKKGKKFRESKLSQIKEGMNGSGEKKRGIPKMCAGGDDKALCYPSDFSPLVYSCTTIC